MSPESSATPTAPTRVIHVPAPTAGQTVSVESSGAGNVQLSFDPSGATYGRSGNNLVFESDNGGRVVLTDFFVVGERPLPSLTLPGGATVAAADLFKGMDLSTAAGPAAGPSAAAAGGGEGEYADNAGSLLDGVDKLGSLGTVHWGRAIEAPLEVRGFATLLNIGMETLLFQTRSLNESDLGTSLHFSFASPTSGTVALTFNVGGSAAAYGKTGVAEFFADYEIDATGATGCTAVFNPDTGTLVVTIPAGATSASVPIVLLDDHINDGPKDILITLAPGGVQGDVVITGTPNLRVDISDDSLAGHDHDPGDPHETTVLDGPVVGLVNIGPATLYEGDPSGNAFTFGLTLTDPHSDGAYQGYTGRSGTPDMLMSQDMNVFINPAEHSGGATYGQDYHLAPSAALAALKAAGMVDYALNADGSFALEADGTVKITLFGQVDANGVPHTPGDGTVAFDLHNTADLTIAAKVLINGSGMDAGENAEDFSLAVAGTTGNESQPAAGAAASAEIGKDPVLGVSILVPDVNESLEHLTVDLAFDKPVGSAVDCTATLKLSGDAKMWDGNPDNEFQADLFLPGKGVLQLDGTVVSSLVANGSPVTLTYNPADGTLTISGKGVSFPMSLDFEPNDDHIGESPNETVTFTLEKVTLNDGHSTGGVGIDPGASSAQAHIADDDSGHVGHSGPHEADVLDGPLVGISGSSAAMLEGDVRTLTLTLKDPHAPTADYQGYDKGLMSQDMVLTVSVRGANTPDVVDNSNVDYGVDYLLRPTTDLMQVLQKYLDQPTIDALIKTDAGGKLYIELDANGSFDLMLPGRVGADGNGSSAGLQPFDLANDLEKLTFEVDILDDDLSERFLGHLTFNVTTDGKNESLKGPDGELHFDVKEGLLGGPILSLYGPDEIRESGEADMYFSPRDNRASYIISLDKAAAEDIRITLAIDPLNADTKDSGPEADYTYDGSFIAHMDDNSMQTLSGVYNPVTQQWELTIPKGAVFIAFGVHIVDDLREIPSEAGEGYTVSFDLVVTNGLPDCEARIAPGKDAMTTKILEETRADAGDPLNPQEFDGPFVMLSGTTTIDESTGVTKDGLGNDGKHTTADYTLSLYSPDGAGTPYVADEPVVVTLTLTLDTADATDLDLTGWLMVDATHYTRDFTLAKGADALSFSIPLVDDHKTEGAEQYSLQITKLSGNEARLWGANHGGTAPGSYETDGRYIGDEISTAIAEDKPENFDGPVIGLTGAASGTEGTTLTFDVTLKDPANPSLDYTGINGNGLMSQDMTFSIRLTGVAGTDMQGNPSTSVYDEDYRFGDTQQALQDLLANGWLKADPISGMPYTILVDGNGDAYLTITVNGTNSISGLPGDLSILRNFLKVEVDVLDDAGGAGKQRTEINEKFELSIVDASGNEARASDATLSVDMRDNANGVFVNLYGGYTVTEGENLPFYLTIGNTAGGAHLGKDVVLQDIGVDITFTQTASGGTRFSGESPLNPDNSLNDSADKSNSQDYNLNALADKLNALYGPETASLTVSGDGLTAVLHLNIAPEDWGTAGSNTGGYKLEIPSIQDLFGEGTETVTATITAVSGSEARIGTATAGDKLTDGTSLKLSISGEPIIYEDNAHGQNADPTHPNADGTWNTALYTVTIATQFPAGWPATTHPVENFTFRVNLNDGTGAGGATYDGNIIDDAANRGDFRWAFQNDLYTGYTAGNGTPVAGLGIAGDMSVNYSGTNLTALCKAVTDWLHDKGYLPEGISVSGVANGGTTLIFTVSEGYTFSNLGDIKLPVIALDDALSEGDEKYTVTLSNVAGHEAVGSGSVETVIKDDETDWRDGFRIGIEPNLVLDESSGSTQHVNLVLYNKDGSLVTTVPTLTQTTTVTLLFGTDGVIDPAEMFADYRLPGAHPTKVTINGKEYWQAEVVIHPGDWHLENGKIVAGVPVQAVDDKLTEGDERFTVELAKVDGNEMTELLDGSGKPQKGVVVVQDDSRIPGADANGTIVDPSKLSHNTWTADGRLVQPGSYDETDRSGAHVLDGPKFLFFTQTEYRVYEPSSAGNLSSDAENLVPGGAPNRGAPETGLNDGYVHYAIGFDSVVSDEPVLIALNLGGGASLGVDFISGSGLGHVNHDGSVSLDGVTYPDLAGMWSFTHGGDALPKYMQGMTSAGGWFVVAEPGRSSADFSIKILPDHLKDGGETITWKISGMAGNEVIFAPEAKPDGSTSDTLTTTVLDDGDGPKLSLTCDDNTASNYNGDTAHYTLNVSSTAGEDYTATFRFVKGENMYPTDLSGITVKIDGVTYTPTVDTARSTFDVLYYNLTIPGGFSGAADVYLHAAQNNSGGNKIFYFGLDGTNGGGESSADTGLIPGRIEGSGGIGNGYSLLTLTGGGEAVEGSGGAYSGLDGDGDPVHGLTFTVTRTPFNGDYSVDELVFFKVLLGENCEYPGDFKLGNNVFVFDQQPGYLVAMANIPAGQASIDIQALFYGDTKYEGDEQITVLLTGGGTIDLNHSMAEGVIIDDDASKANVSLELHPTDMVTVNGDTGFIEGGNAVFYLNLEAAVGNSQSVLSNDVTVTLTYTPGSAAEGEDYTPITHTVVIPAGTSLAAASSWPVYIPLPDNEVEDGARAFTVTIGSVSGLNGGVVDTAPHTVTVLDDSGTTQQDGLKITLFGTTGHSDAGMDYASEDDGEALVTVTVDKVATQDVTLTMKLDGMERVDLVEENGEVFIRWMNPGDSTCDPHNIDTWPLAKINPDGTFIVTLPAGRNELEINLPAKDDALSNGDTPVKLSIVDIHGGEASISGPDSYTFTVVDDASAFDHGGIHFDASPDGPTVDVRCTAASISERGGAAEFVVDLSKVGAETMTVGLQLAPGMLERIELCDASGAPLQPGDPAHLKVEMNGNPTYVPVAADGTFQIVVPAGTVEARLPIVAVNNLITDPVSAYGLTVTGVLGAEGRIGAASAPLIITEHLDGPMVSIGGGPVGDVIGEADGTTTYTLSVGPSMNTNYGQNLEITVTPSPVGTGAGAAVYGTHYAWGDLNTALSGYAYSTAANGTLTLTLTPAQLAAFGTSPHTFNLPVSIIDDATAQGAHGFRLDIATTGSEAAIEAASVTTTILDNDHAPTVHDETAIFLWDGDAGNITLHGNLLGNDFDADGDPLSLHAFDGSSRYGTFVHSAGTGDFDFTLNLADSLVGSLPNGGKLITGMDAVYGVTDGTNVTEGRLHVEVHRTATFDGSGRTEDLVIQGSDSGNHITGGAGNDIIHAGKGNDILNGGTGDDLYVFDGSRAGGVDVINGFDFRPSGGAGAKDLLAFGNIFGDGTELDDLLALRPTEDGDNTFTFAAGADSLTAEFTENSGLELTFNSAHGQVQTIIINSNTSFYDIHIPLDANLAQEILMNVIKQSI